MKTTIKAGNKVTTHSGKVYTATGRATKLGNVYLLHVERTAENDFKDSIEFDHIASVESA